jgi:hypothetical protein
MSVVQNAEGGKEPMAKEMTLAEHAEAWWRKKGKRVPRRDTKAWQRMYETWVEWAFSDLRGEKTHRRRRRSKQLMS